ncbi:hypothetical protein BDM02DRAFT_3235344 [Thelephora ganbajun]|uniref:Uncharacterized protein n=1 Tax=Thelephora ganbajun TaxID=370292 RepID=A0ACB6ZH00_THEGA|nr:hypothetical protein BDM02DRAFT_3235344 [Thelephora ganbajun]
MFYYISFLRPPPSSSTPGSISFTPQVANDLRTELFLGTQDIYYAWLSSTESLQHTQLKPRKLMTWSQAVAYKEISVALPPNARPGQLWRLLLSASPSIQHISISFGNVRSTGRVPFPVISMPIRIAPKPEKGPAKQTQIERMYRASLAGLGDLHFLLREQTSFDLDKKVWDSGIGLSSWLVDLLNHSPPDTEPLVVSQARDALLLNPCNTIELGTGTGIVSIILSALKATRLGEAPREGQFFTTDLTSAIPLLSHNINFNAKYFTQPSDIPQPLALNWDDESLPEQVVDTGGFEVILMADVTYNTVSFPSLLRTLSSLVQLNTKHSRSPPVVILGYKERDPDERSLWGMLESEVGLRFERVGECEGWPASTPVEFWIGQVKPPLPS